MVINFSKSLDEALVEISFEDEHFEWELHQQEISVHTLPKDQENKLYRTIFEVMQQTIPAILNEKFSDRLKKPFPLRRCGGSDLSWFLFETHANTCEYSEYEFASDIHLWIGKTGFVVGVEQKGKGYDAVKIDDERIVTLGGGGFNIYRKTEQECFFDNPADARKVYMKYIVGE